MAEVLEAGVDIPLVKTVFISAPPEKVWAYLTEKAYLGRWWQDAAADLQPDSAYTLLDSKGERLVWGRVVSWDRPEKLVTTFEVGMMPGKVTTVTWELSGVPGGTQLRLMHTGIMAAGGPEEPVFGGLDMGWDKHFLTLREMAKA